MSPSEKEAARRIKSALARIERAQAELDQACSDISSVVGLVEEWEAIGKLSNRVKQFWHRLNNRATDEALDLDGDAKQSLQKKAGGGA